MPSRITVRFFEVGKLAAAGPSLREALDVIVRLGQPGEREVQLTGGFVCRLERFESFPGLLAGEVTRVRDTDYPNEVHPHGTAPLNVDVPIGEGVAFRYREADHRLAMQYDPRIVSPGRFFDYIGQAFHAGQFTIQPTIDADALNRFQRQPLRKAKIRLARPRDLRDVEDAMQPAALALRDLGEAYEAPVVTITLGMERNEGQLAEGAKQMVNGFLRMAGRGEGDVRGITVTPDAGEGHDNEDINLLDALLSLKADLPIPNRDPDASYRIRADHLARVLDAIR